MLIPAEAPSAEIDRLVRERLRTNWALYTLDLPTLEALRPDMIVTQALCDVCAVAEDEARAAACMLPGGPPVVNLEPQTLSQVFDAIRQMAKAADAGRVAEEVVGGLTARVEAGDGRGARRGGPVRGARPAGTRGAIGAAGRPGPRRGRGECADAAETPDGRGAARLRPAEGHRGAGVRPDQRRAWFPALRVPGQAKVAAEWLVICLMHNLLKLLQAGRRLPTA